MAGGAQFSTSFVYRISMHHNFCLEIECYPQLFALPPSLFLNIYGLPWLHQTCFVKVMNPPTETDFSDTRHSGTCTSTTVIGSNLSELRLAQKALWLATEIRNLEHEQL